MNINATLIGQSIAFFVFVWFVMKYVWPPLVDALNERKKKIADGLAAAELGAQEVADAQARAEETVSAAKEQASGIIAQAQKRSSEMVDEAKHSAREEGERMIQAAQAQIEQDISQAKEELRKQVAAIAVSGAEKILQAEIDSKAHSKVLDDLVAQI